MCVGVIVTVAQGPSCLTCTAGPGWDRHPCTACSGWVHSHGEQPLPSKKKGSEIIEFLSQFVEAQSSLMGHKTPRIQKFSHPSTIHNDMNPHQVSNRSPDACHVSTENKMNFGLPQRFRYLRTLLSKKQKFMFLSFISDSFKGVVHLFSTNTSA